MRLSCTCNALSLLLLATALSAQTPQTTAVPQTNSSHIDPDGTAHITRVVPVPTTVSPEAQKSIARPISDVAEHHTVAQERAGVDAWQKSAGDLSLKLYPVHLANGTLAGVPVRIVTPVDMPEANKDRVLINVHGGGFTVDSGSLTETIPIANLAQIKVVAILYRLSPEHPFPAAVDDAVAVYRELLKQYKPDRIGLYGTSAGAILTAQVSVRLRQLNLPLPAALGIFSGTGDFHRHADSESIFSLQGLGGHLDLPGSPSDLKDYLGSTSTSDPVLSPVYADLKNYPPTLFLTSTRDLLLSGTVNLHRAFVQAGNANAELIVFDGLAHAFWNEPELPESKEADKYMADFFAKHLAK